MKFTIKQCSEKGFSLIQWENGNRSLQIESDLANLIAAAPEMVDVLKKVILFGENIKSLSIGSESALIELARNARAAIAKAEGL